MRKLSGNDCSNGSAAVEWRAVQDCGLLQQMTEVLLLHFLDHCVDDGLVRMSYTAVLDFCLFPLLHPSGSFEPGFHA